MSFSMSPDSAFSPSDATPLAPRPTANDTTQMLSPASPAAGLSEMSFPEVISNGAFSKTWVLPPRKKPGRKAANDVPPTKRQAQNRAAQKAFRDRKALRVIELEKENDELRERMERMEAELSILRTAAASGFQQQQQQERQRQQLLQQGGMQISKDSPSQQLASPAPSGGGTSCETCVIGKDCVCLSTALADDTSQSIMIPHSPEESPETKDDACGLCSSTSCLCQDLGLRDSAPTQSSHSPPSTPLQGTKRKRSNPTSPLLPTPDPYPMEIDFTNSFTSTLSPISRRDGLPNGGCGFCSDGTPCVCLQNTLPPLQSDLSSLIPEAHPEAIRRGGGKRPQMADVKVVGSSIPRVGSPRTIASGNGGCTGEPGTCMQCRSDPMSTLFCQTLSKKLETPISSIRTPPNPTTKKDASRKDASKRDPSKKDTPKNDTYLPCSAVYQTLSRHHNFNKMSLESIVDGLARGEHRGMEFSVGGVQGLLRKMDRG